METRQRLVTPARLLILAVVVLVIVMGLWIFLRGQLAKVLTTSLEDLETQGYQTTHDGFTVTGFPFFVDAHTNALSIVAPKSDGVEPSKNWSIKTEDIHVSSTTLTPLSWQITHNGTIRIDMRGIKGRRYLFDLSPANFIAEAGVDFKGQPKFANFGMTKSSITPLLGSSPVIRGFDEASSSLRVKRGDGNFDIDLQGLILSDKTPPQIKTALGTGIETAFVAGTIGNFPVLINGAAGDWQASGATVNIDFFKLKWGDLDVIGDANITMAVDQANGVLTLKFANLGALLKKIYAANLIDHSQYSMTQLLLSQAKTGEDERITIPLTIKNNQLKYFSMVLAEFN